MSEPNETVFKKPCMICLQKGNTKEHKDILNHAKHAHPIEYANYTTSSKWPNLAMDYGKMSQYTKKTLGIWN